MAAVQPTLPEDIEAHRDRLWCREPELRIEEVLAAERFIDAVGFCSAMTDSRRPGPSLYIAVCGRRDAHMPRNVQKDPESRMTWTIKDEVVRRGRVYYGKLRGSRATFITRKLVPHFNTLCGLSRKQESATLSQAAQSILKVLRNEWEMATGDLRNASRVEDRTTFTRAIDELQRVFKVIPTEIVYQPKFTYIWSLAESRFQDELDMTINREEALREIARAYLLGAGLTWRGELARVTGLSNPDAGIGNWALVDEGFATRVAPGVYRLKALL
ncbi:MAG: AlkZ-related protein [Pyrinomonadaceae bacterium]